MEERICETDVLRLEWKIEWVKDGESEGGDCDEVMQWLLYLFISANPNILFLQTSS